MDQNGLFQAIITLAFIFTVCGAVNWGLMGLMKFDLISYLFGSFSTPARVIYCLIGVSGVYLLLFMRQIVYGQAW